MQIKWNNRSRGQSEVKKFFRFYDVHDDVNCCEATGQSWHVKLAWFTVALATTI